VVVWIQARFGQCGACSEEMTLGQVFSEFFGFHYESFHLLLHTIIHLELVQ
jgi:hypothetical protein